MRKHQYIIERKWIRNCPKCKKEIFYIHEKNMISAEKKNSVCDSCSKIGRSNFKGHHHSEKTKNKFREMMLGEKNPSKRPDVKQKIRNALFGKKRPYMVGNNNPSKRLDVIQKLRELRLGKNTPSFNPVACKIIDEYGKIYGYNFQHAMNGGEFRVIGYSVDGYDKEKNVVIEYYEKHHKYQVEEDERRKDNIIEHLNCKFIEIRE